MLVAIPSRGRPANVKSQRRLPTAKVFVPKNEISEYQSGGTKNLVGVPKKARGITATRNFILDWARERVDEYGERVVMVDDDLRAAGWIELKSHFVKRHKLNERQLLLEFERLFDVTEGMGFRIWGVANMSAPRAVYPWKPFLWHSYVTGSCIGILNRGIRFDESFPVKEDYEICLRCIKEDGGIVAARYLFWENSHWADAGGCTDYRTQEMEETVTRRLMKKYPGMIRRVTRGGSQYSIDLEFPTA